LVFTFDWILVIIIAILLLEPYIIVFAWIIDPWIVWKSKTPRSLPVILPELIVPVVVLLLEVNVFCFVSNWDWVIPQPLEEILLYTSIVILVPAVICLVLSLNLPE
jgi:hypothetical protein